MRVLGASSLGGCLVFAGSAVVTVALAPISRNMQLSSLNLQWLMNAELLPLAALTLVAGAFGDRLGRKQVFLWGDRTLWRGRGRKRASAEFRATRRWPLPARSGRTGDPAQQPFHTWKSISGRQESPCSWHPVCRRGCL